MEAQEVEVATDLQVLSKAEAHGPILTTEAAVMEQELLADKADDGLVQELQSSQPTLAEPEGVVSVALPPLEQATPAPVLSTQSKGFQNEMQAHSTDVSIGGLAAQAAAAVNNEITEVLTSTVEQEATAVSPPLEAPAEASVLLSPAAATTATSGATASGDVGGPVSASQLEKRADDVPDPNTAAAQDAAVQSPAIPERTDSMSLKALPKVAADAAKQAGQAYSAAGKEARSTLSSLVTAFSKKTGPPITLTVDQVVTVLFFVFVAFQLLFLPVFMPSFFRLVYCLLWGFLFGLGLSCLFYYNRKRKAEINELLSINLGLKGMYLVAGNLPSWFNISPNEKLEWLNSLIFELWPYVDKGVCEMIKDITAQVMPGILKTLPAGLGGVVKSICFKHLTFGAAPFRVETMWVSPTDKQSLVMEVSVKWCGDPNITLAIEIPGGQKLCPRVMDISFIATIRIVLNPLVDRIPGFVAAMATVPKPPLIKYRLDFGKALGGSMAPAAVTPVINYFIREIITKMLVWPQRLVIPIIQETEQDKIEIQKLMRRHRGVLRVCVVAAKELRAEASGSNDVMAELTTDSENYEVTSTRRTRPVATENKEEQERLGQSVIWNEYIYLLIQEPQDQLLRMEVFDIDKLRPGKLLTGQVTQLVNGRALVGRSLVKLRDVCASGAEGKNEPVGMMAQLGRGEWGSAGGPGKGLGKVRLQMTYWPFEKFTKYDTENAMTGIVTVRLLKVWGLAAAGDSLSAFVRVTSSANRTQWKSSVRTWTRRAHIIRLKWEMKRLSALRERDLREGRKKEAERKEKYLEALENAISGNDKRARLMVDMDYTLDSSAMHAIYHVKLTDVIKVKVIESSLLSSSECLGRLDVPVSDIITANDMNPMTGQREFGLHRKRWEEYNPEQPDRTIDQLERGILLDEGDGARMWLEMRWVPCIQTLAQVVPEEDD